MSETPRIVITRLATGVPGLDEILGGGLPEYSSSIIAGAPGTGKTTLAHQIVFALASAARPALYFSVLGELELKMLRYQQQMDYFDSSKVGDTVRFVSLSDAVLAGDLDSILAEIMLRVTETSPGLVVLDSFHNIAQFATRGVASWLEVQRFMHRLALQLTSWQTTTLMIGNYREEELQNNPVFTVADGILWLSQLADHNSVVRKLQVVKMRGQDPMPGLHTVRLTGAGLQVFPRIAAGWERRDRKEGSDRAISDVPGLDDLLGGGFPAGDAILVSGPSGTGKSVLTTQFIAAGVRAGEPGVIAVFEEHPREYMRRAKGLGMDLEDMERRGQLAVIYLRPLDLSPDETLLAIREAVERIGARRVAIDSVSGFELALAQDFRQDFRESLYRLVGALTGSGITVLMTMEIVQNSGELRFSPYIISFLSDDIILLRHVEIAGQLRKSLAVIKMRNSNHSKELWLYDITGRGLVVRGRLQESQGTGIASATLPPGAGAPTYPGLSDVETVVLEALIQLEEATREELARRTGAPAKALTAALARLVALNYAVRRDEGGSYRAVGRSPR